MRKARLAERRFVAEGAQAVREALSRPGLAVEVLASVEATRRHPDLRRRAAAVGVPWHAVTPAAAAALGDTVSPQGIVVVCAFLDLPVDAAVLPGARLVAVGVEVRDPGNAGAVIRCADAAGADAVVLAGSSVDPYNPKTVRATAGSLFHLPVAVSPGVAEVVERARAVGLTVLAADAAAATDLDAAEAAGLLRRPTAWLFGNEARGLPADVRALADAEVAVPIHGRAESLNLAAAAAVCLYASARCQRAAVPGC